MQGQWEPAPGLGAPVTGPSLEARIQSARRVRTGAGVLGLVLPLAAFLLVERNARRLDALVDHGRPVTATVTEVVPQSSITHYAYRVNGTEYRWNVSSEALPLPAGQEFDAVYLPEDPSMSRPASGPRSPALDAKSAHTFAPRAFAVLALIFGGVALLGHREVRRLQRGAPSELDDAAAYRRRIATTGVIFGAVAVAVTGFHVRSALDRHESLAPFALSTALILGLVGVPFYFAYRDGPAAAAQRSAKVMRWIVPAAIVLAVVRLVAMLFAPGQ